MKHWMKIIIVVKGVLKRDIIRDTKNIKIIIDFLIHFFNLSFNFQRLSEIKVKNFIALNTGFSNLLVLAFR